MESYLTRKSSLILFISVLLLVSLASSCVIFVRRPPPPPPRVEVRVAPPSPRAVWVPGHWKWNRRQHEYIWIPGYWRVR